MAKPTEIKYNAPPNLVNWWRVALLNLFVIGCIGLLLRWMMVRAIPGFNFKNILHAHSHGALLGWLYCALFVALVHGFLPAAARQKRVYKWLFWLAQIAVLGMLLSFPLQGYASVSITFSTLHILFSYGFAWFFLKDCRANPEIKTKHRLSFRFIKLSLWLMVLSSLGPWAMGPIMASGNSFTPLYYNAIYFYLHFQYNGWFTFAVLGLFFRLLEQYNISFSTQLGNRFFLLMAIAVGPAYLLSVLWTEPPVWVNIIGGISAAIQVYALLVFLKLCWHPGKELLASFSKTATTILLFSLLSFILKLLMQLLSALPYFAVLAYKVRHFVIGYLHLVLIGLVSFFLLAYFARIGWFNLHNSVAKTGLYIFLTGFISSEALIFAQGTSFWLRMGAIPSFDLILFFGSILLPTGILLMLRGAFFMPSERELL